MKLNTTHLRYLTSEDWRVLTAVEIGSKNHEIVPTPLIIQLSNLRSGSGVHKSISTLAKANLIARVQHAKYDGYRLTYGGLDYLALHTHLTRHTLASTGPCIGTGKESDIHLVLSPPFPNSESQKPTSRQLICKIHRLGRISFRTVKTNRDYLRHRNAASWMYMSRLSALKEFTFMKALRQNGFAVPEPVAWNRHTVVMELVEGVPLRHVRDMAGWEARRLYAELMEMILRLGIMGLIHGDFNEFNIIIMEDGGKVEAGEPTARAETEEESQEPTVRLIPVLIDFPQMMSVDHANAQMYFDRDVSCVKQFFERRFHFTSDEPGPFFTDVKKQVGKGKGQRLDIQVEASGFSRKMAKELDRYMEEEDVDGDRENSLGPRFTGEESQEDDAISITGD